MKYLHSLFPLTFFLFCIYWFPPEVQAQNNTQTPSPGDTASVVRSVRFVGNDNIKDNTLKNLVRTTTNREFLGIPRFTPWYFLYKVTGRFGEPPALLDRQTVATDMERIMRYYETRGYFDASVDTNIVEFKPGKVEVSFIIDEGQRSVIQTLAYSGMPSFDNKAKLRNFYRSSQLTWEQIDDTTFRVNRPYREELLNTERNRLINFLKNNGYAAAQRDSVILQVRRHKENRNLLDMLFVIEPGRKYTFGDLYISLSGPDNEIDYNEQDTLSGRPFTVSDTTKIYLQKEHSAQTKFSLLTDQILFTPGETFNNSLYINTINEFQNLGMLNIRQFGLSPDGSLPDFSGEQIPVSFTLQTLPRHSVNFNVFGMKRYGFGSGAGLNYTNNNLFGRAENLQYSINGSFEYVRSETIRDIAPDTAQQQPASRFFRSFDTSVEYSLPRLIFPFGALDDRPNFTNARTRYSLSFSRSNQLLFDINSDTRFNLRYEVRHNPRYSSFLDLIELNLLDTDPSQQFREALQQEFGEGSFELQQVLEDFRPQISSLIRYTFRSQNTDIIKRNYGHFSEYSIALGGNIPYLVDRYIITPDTVETNLPSPVSVSKNSLAYSRFVKGTADYRRYISLSDDAVFAYRGLIGLAFPYGRSTSIPLNQRFYAGGSNDIRGWDIYGLGPGAIPLDNVAINGGQIKLMAQVEARQTFIRDIFSSDWIAAWFADAGNIWYGPRTRLPGSGGSTSQDRRSILQQGRFYFDEFYKQIGVGSGLGLRLDWNYLVLRFDFAFRIHDLQEGWFENKKLYFSFGIGHSF